MKLQGFNPATARFRNTLYAKIRDFFLERSVLEVETPILSRGISTDFHIDTFSTPFESAGQTNDAANRRLYYLQTSPELHMKRLLAAGFPDIFQISRVFRNGEQGRIHNPEFTMLEWYRRDFDVHKLIDEIAKLCTLFFGPVATMKKSYRQAFIDATSLDPFETDVATIVNYCRERALPLPDLHSHTDLLQFLMMYAVEPSFPHDVCTFIVDFPAPQAILAALNPSDPRVANRFELYYKGIELGNGYEELSDWRENRARMEEENDKREHGGKPKLPVDEKFIEALRCGIPPCSGVALGLDRIIMLALGAQSIHKVMPFPWEEA